VTVHFSIIAVKSGLESIFSMHYVYLTTNVSPQIGTPRYKGYGLGSYNREKAYIHLNNKIPDSLKFDLNCLFVTHGKLCQACSKKLGGDKSKHPNAACPLASYCCVGENH
jgi:hypothetical protein